MANPITSFAFEASGPGVTTPITMPDRLAYVKNVKDFGAVGNGVADDWAAIMATVNWNRVFVTVTASNQNATFTGAVASATFNGTISGGTTLTINSGLVGTVAVGQTVTWNNGVSNVSDTIASGSGSVWTLSHSQTSIGPTAFTSNCILTATSISGSINVGDFLLNNGGTDASPSTIPAGTFISSQQAGFTGVYVLSQAENFTSQAMMTVTNVLTTPNTQGLFFGRAFDTNNSTVAGNDHSAASNARYTMNPNVSMTLSNINGLVNAGDVFACNPNERGTIFFPPGTYSISEPIGYNGDARWLGTDPGSCVIQGNFSDFIIKYDDSSSTNTWEKLTFFNTNATGGGLQILSDSNHQAIRNCVFVCNQGIITGLGGGGPLDGAIENCAFTYPVGGQTNSYGALITFNCPIRNCTFTGLDVGLMLTGHEGAMAVLGCRFDQCLYGLAPSLIWNGSSFTVDPDGNGSLLFVAGCYFTNNSTGLYFTGGAGGTFAGIRIEGADGKFRGGNCQYGIHSTAGAPGGSLLAGIVIAGNFDQAAVYWPGTTSSGTDVVGVSATNGSTTPGNKGNWSWFDTTNGVAAPGVYIPTLKACNTSLVYPVSGLPGFGFHPAGANEGDEYNVSDGTNGLSWGAPVTNTGVHATPYLLRYNGSAFTVYGQ